MKAWQVNDRSEPEQMRLVDIPVPEPGPDQIRVKNHASALNFFDILQIQGKYQVKPPLPFTPGAEVAGVIDLVGKDVSGFAPGDRVQSMPSLGGFAEYTIVSPERTFRIPDAMSFEEGAAMPVIYQTSYLALKVRGDLKPGEWLLVLGAAGGVGTSALQLGKALGARVIAAAGTGEKAEFCLGQGADHAVNYAGGSWTERVKEITGGRGADVIYDPVGGDAFDLATKCIAPEGRLLVIGFAGGRIPSIAANRILFKNISVVGCYWGGYLPHHPDFLGQAQRKLLTMYEKDLIKPVVSKTYPLTEAVAALRALADRKTTGKVVLVNR